MSVDLMRYIKESEEEQERINLEVFDESYIPWKVLFRDKLVEELSGYIELSRKLKYKRDVMLYGPPATGKTLCVRYLLREIGIKAAYATARGTQHGVVHELCTSYGLNAPRRGLSTDSLLDSLLESEPEIIVVDEIDRINNDDKLSYFIWRLSRVSVSFLAISNTLTISNRIKDPSARSSYNPVEIFFPPYDAVQVGDILLSRVKEAGVGNIISEENVKYIAALCVSRNTDLRFGLNLLKKLIEKSLISGQPITENMIEKTFEEVESQNFVNSIRELRPLHLLIIRILLNGPMKLKSLYEICSAKYSRGLSRQWFSKTIGELEKLGIIDITVIGRGRGRGKEYIAEINSELDKSKIKLIFLIF